MTNTKKMIASLKRKLARAEDKYSDAFCAWRRNPTDENKKAWREAMAKCNGLSDELLALGAYD